MRELKIKQFVYFLLLATVFWFFNHLSKPVTVSTVVKARFSQVPDSLILLSNELFDVPIRVSATGFKLLFTLSSKKPYEISLNKISYENGGYMLAPEFIESSLQSSLSESLTLIRATIQPKSVDAALLSSKKVPVFARVSTSFRPNYIATDSAIITPNLIEVKGVKSTIEKLDKVYTMPVRLEDIYETISINIPIESLNDTKWSYSADTVKYSLNVARFSENDFEIPIKVYTNEKRYKVLLFPEKVTLVCKATTERLKTLNPDDFEVSVTYDSSILTSSADVLKLSITRVPEEVFQISLLTDEVNFIIEPL